MLPLPPIAPATEIVQQATSHCVGPVVFVAPNGDDAGDGDAGRPLRTLAAALAALQSGRARTVRIAPGRYAPGRTLSLGPTADGDCVLGSGAGTVLDGEQRLATLLSLDHAIGLTIAGIVFAATATNDASLRLEGGGTHRIVGNVFLDTAAAIGLDGSSANLVAGNIVLGTAGSAIEAKDHSDDNLFDDNLVEDTGGAETAGGALFLHAVSGNYITDNQIVHTAGMGIGIENWDDSTINTGNVVIGNALLDTDRDSSDSGAIYVLGRSARNTGTIIAGNLIDGTGRADRHSVGIYLDDSTSGVEVVDNVIRHIGSDGVEIHGGDDNLVRGNRFELGTGTNSAILLQGAPADVSHPLDMSGNRIEKNVIASRGPRSYVYVSYDGGAPSFLGNACLDPAASCTILATSLPLAHPAPFPLDLAAAGPSAKVLAK